MADSAAGVPFRLLSINQQQSDELDEIIAVTKWCYRQAALLCQCKNVAAAGFQ